MKIMNTGSKDNEFAEFMRLVGGGWLGAVCVAGGVGVFSGCLGGAGVAGCVVFGRRRAFGGGGGEGVACVFRLPCGVAV